LSKVAFSPGKIVHTNEFYVKQSNGEKKLMSYIEAAEELENSIMTLRQRINTYKPTTQPGVEKILSEQKTTSSSTPPSSLTLQDEEIGRPVEIHETCDQNGQLIDSQVVDLSSQFDSARSVLSELETSDNSNPTLERMFKQLQEQLNVPHGNQTADDSNILEQVNCVPSFPHLPSLRANLFAS
jgi:hypothetical protein